MLNHLCLTDVLNTRLVCRQFALLSSLLRLRLEVRKDLSNNQVASNLQLFISRNCMQPTSPQVSLTVYQGHGLNWSAVMLASMCANLLLFDCGGVRFSLHEAQTCLRVLPASTMGMRLAAPMAIADDAAWGRLTHLTSLSLLHLDPVASAEVHTGSGLALLTALKDLRIRCPAMPPEHMSSYDGQAFTQKSITCMHIAGRDPFSSKLNMANCPALARIYMGESWPVPAWVEGQQFAQLTLDAYQQLDAVNPKRLLVRRLDVSASCNDPGMKISDLLAMPQLQTVLIQPRDDASNMTLGFHSFQAGWQLPGASSSPYQAEADHQIPRPAPDVPPNPPQVLPELAQQWPQCHLCLQPLSQFLLMIQQAVQAFGYSGLFLLTCSCMSFCLICLHVTLSKPWMFAYTKSCT